MNLIEAIKSGKRFRRSSWTHPVWLESHTEDKLNHSLDLQIESVIADDWEVEEVQVTITREQFDKAWSEALAAHFKLDSSWEFGRWEIVVDNHSSIKKLLVKELGL